MSEYTFEHGKPYSDPQDEKIKALVEAAKETIVAIRDQANMGIPISDALLRADKVLNDAIALAEKP